MPSKSREIRKLAASLYGDMPDAGSVDSILLNAINKHRRFRQNLFTILNKTSRMFRYNNLPYTLPAVALERMLQWEGAATIASVTAIPNGYGISFDVETAKQFSVPIYAFSLNMADAPDPYNEPYKVVITNPGFKPSIGEERTVNKDCVVIRNDTYMQGIKSMIEYYAAMLTEGEISLRSTLVTLRNQVVFIAKTEPQKKNIEAYIRGIESGEYVSILAPDLGMPLQIDRPTGSSNAVELAVNGIQAIRAMLLNELGINESLSLKREYVSAQEIETGGDMLMPLIDDMYECRKRGVEQINAMFGTNITVEKDSAWALKDRSVQLAVEEKEAEVEQLEEGDEDVAMESNASEGGTEQSESVHDD